MNKTILKRIALGFLIVLLTLIPIKLWNMYNPITANAQPGTAHVVYQAHCQDEGWMDPVSDGTMAGTSGQSLRLEALTVSLEGVKGSIQYHSYVEKIGWQSYYSNGQVTGTTGKGYKLEAIQMYLTGEAADQYDLYYQVHKAEVGWTGWVIAGSISGNSCLENRIEAIQIMLVPKGAAAPSNLPAYPASAPNVTYSAHVQDIGWQEYASTMGVAGTTGEDKRLEALKIQVPSISDFGIQYKTYVYGQGLQDWTTNNSISGTTGKLLSTTALAVRLTGYQSANYNVFYRTYSNGFGWSVWAKNGQLSGYAGSSSQLEAFQVCIRKKSDGNPSSATPITALTNTRLIVSTHVQDYGWLSDVENNQIAGTTGQNKRMEALKMNISGSNRLQISYSTHVQDIGWQGYASNGGLAGTTGRCKRIEAIRIKLTGVDASKYDIYYRSHVQNVGWLGWAKNDEISGSTALCYRMEALQVIIVPAGSPAPGPIANAYVTPKVRGIDVSRWQNDINWSEVAKSGINFAMIKIGQGSTGKDSKADQNIRGAQAVGIRTGVYVFSNASTVDYAKYEASMTLQWLRDYSINYPVAYDVEDDVATNGLSKSQLTDIILTYKNIIESAGYRFILYANKNYLVKKIDTSRLGDTEIWLAYPDDFNHDSSTSFPYNYFSSFFEDIDKLNITMWQYSFKGKVPGIGTNVDLDMGYKFY